MQKKLSLSWETWAAGAAVVALLANILFHMPIMPAHELAAQSEWWSWAVVIIDGLIALLLIVFMAGIFSRRASTEAAMEEAEAQSRLQHELFDRFLELLPCAVVVKDIPAGHTFTHFNEMASNILGVDAEFAIGRSDFDIWPKEEAEVFLQLEKQIIADKKMTDIPCEVGTNKHGERMLHTRKLPIMDEHGEARFLVIVIEDITDRVNHAVELQRYRQDLEQQVAERTESLNRALTQAEEANRHKSAFLATVSHEMRTPMNGILGMGELLQRTNLTRSQRRYARHIQGSAEQLIKLIEDLLDLAKIEAGRMELDPEPTDIELMLRDLASHWSIRQQDSPVRLAVRMAGDVPVNIVVDRMKLRQMLTNLVGNAFKFTEKGAVTVSVAVERCPQGERLRLSVRDTGIGIDKAAHDKIFDSFRQADASTTRKYGGTGLGLAITGKMVELMGGTVSIDSKPGRGACFDVQIPLQRVDGDEVPAAGELADGAAWRDMMTEVDLLEADDPDAHDGSDVIPNSFAGLRVLVAEDNRVNRAFLEETLDLMGCVYDVAENGRDAVRLAEEKPYDLVLMDCLMPEMDGFTATRAIRELTAMCGTQPDVPIIALTANAMKGDRERCLAAGMDDYLTKPLRGAKLSQLMSAYFREGGGLEADPIVVETDGLQLSEVSVECDELELSETPVELPTGDTTTASSVVMEAEDAMTGGDASEELILVDDTQHAEDTSDTGGGGDDAASAGESVLDDRAVQRAVLTMRQQFPSLLGHYYEDADKMIATLDGASGNIDDVVRAAHSLKSMSFQMGAVAIAEQARELERKARQAAEDGGYDRWVEMAPGAAAALSDLMTRTRSAFETYAP